MPSVRRDRQLALLAVAGVFAAGSLGGCSTTQEKAAAPKAAPPPPGLSCWKSPMLYGSPSNWIFNPFLHSAVDTCMRS